MSQPTDLLEIAHHSVLVAPEYAAEELHDLLVVEVVNALHDARQEQLDCQVEISVELIYHEANVQQFKSGPGILPPNKEEYTNLRLSLSSETFQ